MFQAFPLWSLRVNAGFHGVDGENLTPDPFSHNQTVERQKKCFFDFLGDNRFFVLFQSKQAKLLGKTRVLAGCLEEIDDSKVFLTIKGFFFGGSEKTCFLEKNTIRALFTL